MQRREFLKAGGVSLAGAVASAAVGSVADAAEPKHTFKLKYGPHFGMFEASAGKDLTDQLRFAADQGFTAWEDNGMKGRLEGGPGKDRPHHGAGRHHDGRVRGGGGGRVRQGHVCRQRSGRVGFRT